MKKALQYLIPLLGWFAVVAQFCLVLQNSTDGVAETLMRFFTFFTILTNILVAVYFTTIAFGKKLSLPLLTAVTIYITIVGSVYQIALRHIWQPEGLQRVVDELLHTLVPLLVVVYWSCFRGYEKLLWNNLPKYLIYPLLYLLIILVRGIISGYYPYYFLDVTNFGWLFVFKNILILFGVIVSVCTVFISINNAVHKAKSHNG